MKQPICIFHATANLSLRIGQFVAAISVAALSGVDLGRWSKSDTQADSRWVYAEVVAAFSAIASLSYGFRRRDTRSTAYLVLHGFLQASLSLLWVVLSAVYGQIVAPGANMAGLEFTKPAVAAALGFSIISALLWFAAIVMACLARRGSAGGLDAEQQGEAEMHETRLTSAEDPTVHDCILEKVDFRGCGRRGPALPDRLKSKPRTSGGTQVVGLQISRVNFGDSVE